ncbi:MAG TPA: DUF4118 domain-containing protein, partial [Longimicrobiaceae bacterium]|nr:DUF4118 domain-containing protein [Longimicrobiaceae bacterium]
MTPDSAPDARHGAPASHLPPPLRRYGMAVLATAGATGAAIGLSPLLGPLIFPPYFLAVFLMGWYGGLGAGLLTSVLSVFAASFFVLEPHYTLALSGTDLVKVVAFGVVSYVSSVLSGDMHRARARAETHALEAESLAAELREQRDQLQDQAAELQEQAAELEIQQQQARDLAGELEARMAESDSLRREVEDANRRLTVAVREARVTSERLAGVLETMAEGVVVTDAAGSINFMNAAAARMLAIPEGPEGQALRTAFRPLRPDGTPVPDEERVVMRVLRTGEPASGAEIEILREGRRAVLRVSAAA